MEQKLFNTKEASTLLNIERATLYLWRNKGKIKMHKYDGQYYVTAEDLQPLLDERLKTGKAQRWTGLTGDAQKTILIEMPNRKYDSETQ
ncbi:helix-turn-helix domain-containing protein [Sphingobacterium sp. UBA2074]|uniref:helix-turn-helix domain-containing protein n=1 Tax=Sphingobacterium sp. UBA2074 TaxID=1947487 RepID=UPI00258024F1|nr:helix-turn-helix domain-containing protein [Sphingobacterium sp. UBA2074]